MASLEHGALGLHFPQAVDCDVVMLFPQRCFGCYEQEIASSPYHSVSILEN